MIRRVVRRMVNGLSERTEGENPYEVEFDDDPPDHER